jgi:hypothetical protein
MKRSLLFLLTLAALAIPATSWATTSTSSNLAINVTAGQAITAVTLSNNSFTGGAPSGTVVGAINVTMSPASPAFSGSLSVTGTNSSQFQIVGGNLVTKGVVATGNYQVNIVATEAGVAGSPFTQAEAITGNSNGNASGSVAFTALNIRYMSPTGSDSSNGLTPATAWASPNHPMNCGDVIIAAPGSYAASTGLQNFGSVSNCPSTSGGIDGTGGIWFATLLCGGNVGACSIPFTGAGPTAGITVRSNNWAVEGFQVVPTNLGRAFEANACASGTTIVHHIAFINDIAIGASDGFDTNDCAINHNVPGNGVDYFAVVGSIAQNSARDSICLGAIDIAGPANFDSGSGTHLFFGGDFGIANRQPTGCSDGEAFILDTLDAHGYGNQAAVEQNIGVGSGQFGLQIFNQFINSSTPHINVFNNTFFDNFYVPQNAGALGEINYQPNGTNSPWIVSITNNIARTRTATDSLGGPVYALLIGNPSSNTTDGESGTQNIFKGLATSCAYTCDSGDNVVAFNGATFGTNTYLDPAFKNTTDLINNHYGVPNCTKFETTTACMGWNQATQTITALSVIDDMTATATGTADKGYQPPGPCTADPYYPSWLKGVVYLHWDGSALTERDGLLTKPCGL